MSTLRPYRSPFRAIAKAITLMFAVAVASAASAETAYLFSYFSDKGFGGRSGARGFELGLLRA